MGTRSPAAPTARRGPDVARRRLYPFLAGIGLAAGGWTVIWGMETWWKPIAFAALWTGAALVMWAAGRDGYPSVRRHLALAVTSIPLWWWFELVNMRVRNWEYLQDRAYGPYEYAVLSSLAFSTVVPALVAAVTLVQRVVRGGTVGGESLPRRGAVLLIGAGLALQGAVMLVPTVLYPFVWIAPFLVFDGLVSIAGGRSLLAGLLRGHWREAAVIGAAGLLCGVLWEFWNFRAAPKWVYHIPFFGFGKIFEMPVLGYGGYVPFAWSVIQMVRWVDRLWERRQSGGPGSAWSPSPNGRGRP